MDDERPTGVSFNFGVFCSSWGRNEIRIRKVTTDACPYRFVLQFSCKGTSVVESRDCAREKCGACLEWGLSD
jgi:hypothetical protein